jgi:nucleoside-diphosphate-sugar epimerase
MLSRSKILITGPAGQIAFPLAEALAADNEVWGVARFSDGATRDRVEAAGVHTVACDLGAGDFAGLPDDFDYVLHLATFRNGGLDYDAAMRVNAEGTQLLMQHCRRAKGFLVMSTAEVYKPHADPLRVIVESDPLGDSNSLFDPTYSMSKIAQEGVARSCARAYDLPVVIARMNASYGDNGGLPTYHLDWILAGKPVMVKWDPAMYSPIHQDDINTQAAALLGAASVPATIVNWGGDEPVSAQEWCAYLGELTGHPADVVVREVPGGIRGIILDNTRRLAITGPCQVGWRDGLQRVVEHRLSAKAGAAAAATVGAQAERLASSFAVEGTKP